MSNLAIAYAMKKKAHKMGEHKDHKADGGQMCAHGSTNCEMCHGGKYSDGGFVHEEEETGYRHMPKEHAMHNSMATHEDDKDLGQHGMHEHMPDGHDFEAEHETHYDHAEENQGFPHEEEDMVSRIMKHRKGYSHGGQVANKTDVTADFEPNEFDDMPKDDEMEEHYTGANSGDEIGDKQEDEDRHDIVARIMKSRHKKGHMPTGYKGYM